MFTILSLIAKSLAINDMCVICLKACKSVLKPYPPYIILTLTLHQPYTILTVL